MLQQSVDIVAFLKSKTEFTSVMQQKIYPIVALPGTNVPFATYRINEETPFTKEATQANLTVFFWFDPNKYKDCVEFTDAMKTIFENESPYNWLSSSVDYIEENNSFAGIINLNTI